MTTYIKGTTSQTHLAAGDQVKEHFDPSRHGVIAADVKTYLGWHAKYAAKQKAVDAAEAKEDTARQTLAEADTVRDDATLGLDRALIADGANKQNSFKQFGVPAPAACVTMPIKRQTTVINSLVSKVSKSKGASKAVLAAAKALAKANAAVKPKEASLKAVAAGLAKARAERDALDRPLRRALSVLKLRARAAEVEGASGLYAELFATEPRRDKADKPLPEGAPTPPVA